MKSVAVPTRILMILAAGWMVTALFGLFWADTQWVWTAAAAALAAAVLADLLLAWRRGCPVALRRESAVAWPVGVAQTVRLVLRNRSGGALEGRVFDHVPDALLASSMPLSFVLPADREALRPLMLDYRATAQVRGPQAFGPVEVRLTSPLRLFEWRFYQQVEADSVSRVRVYPDFARIAQYTLMATDNRLSQLGVLRRRRRGEGMEFHQLREYRDGDSPRQIDWKATARHNRPISREYQDERNQQIVFLLDCGLRMRTREASDGDAGATLSHFDHTLNAMLLLTYVALRQGDGVGLSTFAHPQPRQFAPRKSASTLNLLMNAVYDLEPTLATPDFLGASQALMAHVRKRSLIIVLTNLRDEDDDTLMPAVALLRRQHLVLVASLREPGLAQLRAAPVRDFDDALAYAAASDYLQARQRSLSRLAKGGVHCLDVAPAALPVALVNQYWTMKRSGAL